MRNLRFLVSVLLIFQNPGLYLQKFCALSRQNFFNTPFLIQSVEKCYVFDQLYWFCSAYKHNSLKRIENLSIFLAPCCKNLLPCLSGPSKILVFSVRDLSSDHNQLINVELHIKRNNNSWSYRKEIIIYLNKSPSICNFWYIFQSTHYCC